MGKTLALCMIVKNEEQYLPYAIASVIKYIDELIIIDTGSTDKTIEIAEAFCKQAKQGMVIQMPWKHDFALARNVSQAPAKSDWILWLDADEVLHDLGIKKVKNELINDSTCDFYLIPRLNFWKDLKHVAWYPDSQYKLYRNNGVRWQGKIHEKLFDNNIPEHRTRLKQTDVHTFHYAYLKQEDEVAEKMANYIKIENPDMDDAKIKKCSREHSFFYNKEHDFLQPYNGVYPEVFHRIQITNELLRWKDGPLICRFSKKLKDLEGHVNIQQINKEHPPYKYTEPDWAKEYKDKLTSIIIVTYNKLEYVKPCIQGIYESTQVPFELILVDNGSDQSNIGDYAKQLKAQYDNFKYIRSEKNLGFAKGYNKGVEASEGEFICILNNDTRVTDGWIGKFIKHYESRRDVAIIGPVSNNIHGEHQMIPMHEGASFGEYLTLMEDLKKKEEHHLLRESSWVTGCCMFFHRSLLKELAENNRHGTVGIFFDERFKIGMGEDSDVIFRCHHEVCKKVFVARDVFIWHEGQRTLNDVTKKEGITVEQLQHDNNLELRKKWGKEIFPDFEG